MVWIISFLNSTAIGAVLDTAAIFMKQERLLLNLTKVLMENTLLYQQEIRELVQKYGSTEVVETLDFLEETIRDVLIKKIQDLTD